MSKDDSKALRAGDTAVCINCGRGTQVSQSWIEITAERLKKKQKLEIFNHGFNPKLVAELPAHVLDELTCAVCKNKGAVKLRMAQRQTIPEKLQGAVELGEYQKLCSKCGGFNGLSEYCFHCGGTGYEPSKSDGTQPVA
ncbi:UNVERIFIED_ORG: hypothetical protein LHJ69_16330 [Shinella sp. XGS7]|nr:hypothetical protein [Shinella sp. XGS7]